MTLVYGGLGEDGHGSVGAGDADVVAGEGGEVVEQAAEAAVGVAGFVMRVGSFGLSGGQAQLAGHRSDRGDMPVRQRPGDRDRLVCGHQLRALQGGVNGSMTCGGSIARLASVSCLTLPPSR